MPCDSIVALRFVKDPADPCRSICLDCGESYGQGTDPQHLTTYNLVKHLRDVHKVKDSQHDAITRHTTLRNHNQRSIAEAMSSAATVKASEKVVAALTAFIVVHQLSFRLSESPLLLDLLHAVNPSGPRLSLPSRFTISRRVDDMY